MRKPSLQLPEPGDVINYSYLWRHEYEQGRDEGIKDRPVAVVVVVQTVDGIDKVLVVPLTTTLPRKDAAAIELPEAVRKHLGLKAERSWIIVDEWNEFSWPGFDIRPIDAGSGNISYGALPASLFRRVRDAIIAGAAGRPINRDT